MNADQGATASRLIDMRVSQYAVECSLQDLSVEMFVNICTPGSLWFRKQF